MRAGKLNRRITIQQLVQAKNQTGGMVASWEQFAVRRANVNNLSGTEGLATKAHGGEVADARTIFTMRYLAGVTETMRVLYGGKVFNIRFVNDVLEGHRTLIVTCDTGATEGL
jgi:SPP1 family predicted phage head-tail adaptor